MSSTVRDEMRPTFSSEAIPLYHEGMLLVRMQPLPTLSPAAVAAGTTRGVTTTSGMAVLAFFERAGMVRRVVPVTPAPRHSPTPPAPGGGIASMLAGPLTS